MNVQLDAVLLWTTFLLGLRHSFDVDHLAAITDISAAQTTRRGAIWGSLGYALGHVGIVFLLGGLALWLGFSLPESFSHIFEKLVGVTLILLGVAVFYSAVKLRDEGKIISRWRLLFGWARNIRARFRKNKPVADDKSDLDDLGFFGCTLIGVLHGIGVESPTQLLALGSAAAIGSFSVGFTLISVFSIGMVLSNMAIAWVSIFGFQNARRRKVIFFWLSLVSAILSTALGIKLLLA
ncbi:MAG: hypothetical protein SGJ27_20580 [Candidatus Melainabacteria bacterium]|nr:hypothetical protein [Candidatus Melainabacteria bacterium]